MSMRPVVHLTAADKLVWTTRPLCRRQMHQDLGRTSPHSLCRPIGRGTAVPRSCDELPVLRSFDRAAPPDDHRLRFGPQFSLSSRLPSCSLHYLPWSSDGRPSARAKSLFSTRPAVWQGQQAVTPPCGQGHNYGDCSPWDSLPMSWPSWMYPSTCPFRRYPSRKVPQLGRCPTKATPGIHWT